MAAMGKISENIYADKDMVIPLADVQHIEKKYHDHDLVDGTKTGDLMGSMIITKHTKWSFEHDTWENGIWLSAEQTTKFLSAWYHFRSELDGVCGAPDKDTQ